MAGQSLHSPTKPHFFQPLLPGFHSHLNMPVSFFSKHVEGRHNQNKTAKLRSDASEKTWSVKMDGLKFTDGWEDFAVAHDLRIGDIIIFRHEGDMVFHVTALGPSCCEIQYTSSTSNETDVTGNRTRVKRKRVKKNRRKKAESSSSDHSHFEAKVSASSLEMDRLYLPRIFARSNGLDKMSGEKILLLNEEGRSWNLNLKYNEAGMHTFIRPGWRRFCAQNGMKQGHYTFKLVQKSGPPVIRLCRALHRAKTDQESSLHHSCYVGSVTASRASSSYSQDQFVTLTLTPSVVNSYKLYLPQGFTRLNGINKPGKITLLGEDGVKKVVDLLQNKRTGTMRIGKGWREFCDAHGVKIGESFVLELIWEEKASPVLKFCTKVNSV
ncbi:B3 domain-containing protein REM17 isoform X2 [Eutrema salsugineum]|uniref:B3 domain-containing protein REM17 isoform X2 n=1 Tax=Eutrema salsugineum TaxID=72664 RepID=UPI000CED1366|nr:B3 domain-containing protein REM17 isoform X2 [Eutrema salsugineum]